MTRWLEPSFRSFLVICGICCVSGVGAITLGVGPDAQHEYVAGKAFRCASGRGEEVPFTSVNDNFCDCADGSDEPGTGACAGQEETLFHCNNEGSTPQMVYASRVDDGICDCCDGSDEAGLAARHPRSVKCVNSCKEEGARERVERAEKIEQLKVGLSKKEEIKAQAAKDRKDSLNQINALKLTLPVLESGLAEAKATLEKEEEETRKTNATDHLRDEVDALKATVQTLTDKVEHLQNKLERFEANGGTGKPLPVEATQSGAEGANAGGEKKKEVVSEYAKWMDGAGDTPGAIADEDPEALSAEEAERLAADDYGEEDDEDLPERSTTTGTGAKVASAASLAVTEAERKLRENKAETTKVNTKMEHLEDEAHIGFAALYGECLEKNDGQYTYKLCFFDDAKQDSVLLGRWDKWTGPKEAHFSNGQMCPGGPARELNVIFECGAEIEVNEMMEPSRCVYETRVSHPGACDPSDQADLEKPLVKHPKDEL